MKEQDFDYQAIIRAEGEGMVLRKQETACTIKEIARNNVSFDVIAEERATGEGMPEVVARKR